jgi:transcriptional regulator GlxA family with amidase domain
VRFSAEMGVSPQQYVRLVRVQHAQRLLRRGLPPSIVAAEMGFFDQSHLCRHFKRVLGSQLFSCIVCRYESVAN